MQEVFVRAYRGLQQLREPGRLREWLSSIAFNVARTQAACEQRWQRTRAAFEPERLRFEPADQQEPLLRELRIEAVRALIQTQQFGGVEAFFRSEFVVLREGEGSLSELWYVYQEKRISMEERIPIDRALQKRVRRDFPPPHAVEFV